MVHETGEAFTIKQLRRRAYRLMEILGLRRVRLYDARASCLTFLANNGVPDHILARWAGHTNVKTTKKWYVKPDVEDLRAAATACTVRRRGVHEFGGVPRVFQVATGAARKVARYVVPSFGAAPHALLQTRSSRQLC